MTFVNVAETFEESITPLVIVSKNAPNICCSFNTLIMTNLSYIEVAWSKYNEKDAFVSLIRKFRRLGYSPFLHVEPDSVILRGNNVKGNLKSFL